MKQIKWKWLVFAVLLTGVLVSSAMAQNRNPAYDYGNICNTTNGNLTGHGTIGQHVVGTMTSSEHSTSIGLWGFYLREPFAPEIKASQGDYPDRIIVEWTPDILSAPADGEVAFRLYRDSTMIAELPYNQMQFTDNNVIAGTYYNYELEAINEYGTSPMVGKVGFINPNGVITGSVTTAQDVPMPDVEVTVMPNLGKSLNFNGFDAYAEVPPNEVMNNESFTLEFWFKTGVNRAQGLASKGFRLSMIDETGAIEFDTPGDVGNLTTSPTDVTTWYHIAATYDADTQTAKLYLNATLQDTASGIASMEGAANVALTIGTDTTSYFVGNIDDVRLWSTARSETDIRKNMERTVVASDVEHGLVGYWKLDEGMLTYIFDLTDNDLDGDLYNIVWSNQKADISTSAFTDIDGNYIIEGINYGGGTTFTVTPRKTVVIDDSTTFEHIYNPNFRYVTLNPSNTARDGIDFTDISLIPVSGYVRYAAETACPEENVMILVDGAMLRPPVMSQEDGSFVLELIPGSTHQISASLEERTFTLENGALFYQVDNISQPIADLVFYDQTTRDLQVNVFGGNEDCQQALTPQMGDITVTVQSTPACFERTLTLEGTSITFDDIPPLDFAVTVDHPDPDIEFVGKSISLVDSSGTLDFIYRAPVEVDIQITGADSTCPGLLDPSGQPLPQALLLDQDKQYQVNVWVYEDYSTWGGSTCPTQSGSITFGGDIFDGEETTMEFTDGGIFGLPFKPGRPNMLSGGEHPYQKSLEVVAYDDIERTTNDIEWVYITGHSPRNQTFTTVTPDLPMYILRDPPGDGSYSYFSTGMTMSNSVSYSYESSAGVGVNTQIKMGADFTISAGIGIATETETNVEITTDYNFSMTRTQTNSNEFVETMTTTETFTTAGDEDMPGQDSDIYIGGARNILYGLTDVMSISDTTCSVVLDTTIMFVPGDFATFFIYSEYHILNGVIPALQTFVDYYNGEDMLDSAAYYQNQIDTWNETLALNDSLKSEAEVDPLHPNVSFDGASGAYQSETSYTSSSSRTIGTQIQVNNEVALTAGATVGGIGGFVTISGNFSTGQAQGSGYSEEQTTTTGYVLDDNDAGDYFSVDIKKDGVYGTPVFDLVGGTSSCPWEVDTQPRAVVTMSATPTTVTGLESIEPAVFNVTVGNESESGEDMTYEVGVVQTSNPYGAVIKFNGLEPPISLSIPAGEQVDFTMTVDRGPDEYIYNDLQIEAYSPCEMALGNLTEYSHDVETFNIEWVEPCSEITLNEPQANWLLTPDDNDTLWVTITDYDLSAESLQGIKLMYRPRWGGGSRSNEWILATDPIPIDSLQFDYVIIPWDVTLLDDGEYEIRAVTECLGDDPSGASGIIPGMLQRRPPHLFGTPDPMDGVFEPNDIISVSFNEEINCQQIDPLFDLELTDLFDASGVNYEWSCNENQIIFAIPMEYNQYYENHTIRAKVKNIEDMYQNAMTDSIIWEFLVNRNPLEWVGTDIDILKYEDEPITVTRHLINNGGYGMDFDIGELPDWLTVSPPYGTIPPSGTQEMTIEISDQVSGGIYEEVIYAESIYGDEPMRLNLRVLCYEPLWVVDPAQYEFSMPITAQLYIDDEISTDTYDMVAAYIDGEVRGVGNVAYLPGLDLYEVFLSVYSNNNYGEEITFKVWDSSTCSELGIIEETYIFDSQAVIGSPTDPATITATSQITQDVPLYSGWTWFSLNVESDDMSVNGALSSIDPTDGDLIKSHTDGFSQYYESEAFTGWWGSMDSLRITTTYFIKLTQGDTLKPIGYPANLDLVTIPINSGWTWISYLPQVGMDLNTALSSLDSLVSGDLIKTQNAYAQYVPNFGWYGSLTFMRPHRGYGLKTAHGGTLQYPIWAITGGAPPIVEGGASRDSVMLPDGWQVDPANYEYSMTMTGIVEMEEQDITPMLNAVSAFVDGECRGIAYPEYVEAIDGWLIFLMVYSNDVMGEDVEFYAYHGGEEAIYSISNVEAFEDGANLGQILSPYIWTIGASTGVDDVELNVPTRYDLSQNYPNPFNPETTIRYELPKKSDVELAIYNVQGQLVRTLVSESKEAGYYKVVWDGTDDTGKAVPSGMYIYTMKADDFEKVRRLVMLK